MFKSSRLLFRSTWQNVGILVLFEGVCCLAVLLLKNADNIFGTYVGACTMMSLIIVMMMGLNWTGQLVNVGLSMGATRKGMWSAIQLNLLVGTLICVLVHFMTEQANRIDFRVLMSLKPEGVSLVILIGLTLLAGNAGALLGMIPQTWGRTLLMIGLVAVVVFATLCAMSSTFEWFDASTLFWVQWGSAAASFVLAAVCSAAVYVKLRVAQVQST